MVSLNNLQRVSASLGIDVVSNDGADAEMGEMIVDLSNDGADAEMGKMIVDLIG